MTANPGSSCGKLSAQMKGGVVPSIPTPDMQTALASDGQRKSEGTARAIDRLEVWLDQGGPSDVSQWADIASDLRSVLAALGRV